MPLVNLLVELGQGQRMIGEIGECSTVCLEHSTGKLVIVSLIRYCLFASIIVLFGHNKAPYLQPCVVKPILLQHPLLVRVGTYSESFLFLLSLLIYYLTLTVTFISNHETNSKRKLKKIKI